MNNSNLEKIAKLMVAPNKGILAADESTNTIKKRLNSIGLESNEENRKAYREMLFTTPNIENFISGVILFEETLKQSSNGKRLSKVLEEKNIIPGIKVDKGICPCPGYEEFSYTQGFDGLRQRCEEYYGLGAKFAKWRAVVNIINNQTPEMVIKANAQALALYASTAQSSNLVPIVEPEVLMDGDHSINICRKITEKTLEIVFSELENFNVNLKEIVLKPNMILPGSNSNENRDSSEIAAQTIEVLKKYVPENVPGIAFLSGGQTEIEATENLSSMNMLNDLPWELTFSYGRALQHSALNEWKGKKENIIESQKIFLHRANMNSLAHAGQYSSSNEQ